MSDTHKKLTRIRRIHHLEDCQLSALVAQVVRLDAVLNASRKQRGELIRTRDQSWASDHRPSLEMLTQNGVWVEHLDRAIATLEQSIRETEQQRQQAQQRVMEQRSRVRGLEILIDQLRFDLDSQAETEQMLIADENALNDFAGN
jgi:chromosome segregation ATPase